MIAKGTMDVAALTGLPKQALYGPDYARLLITTWMMAFFAHNKQPAPLFETIRATSQRAAGNTQPVPIDALQFLAGTTVQGTRFFGIGPPPTFDRTSRAADYVPRLYRHGKENCSNRMLDLAGTAGNALLAVAVLI